MKHLVLIPLFFIPLLLTAQTQRLQPAVEWQKTFGGSKYDFANTVIPTTDHGFLVVGGSHSNDGQVTGHHGSTDSSDAWVIKLNQQGDMEWQRSYGGSNTDWFKHAVQAANGDFICVGSTRSTDGDVTGLHGANAMHDVWVVRIDRYGAIKWSKVFGGSGQDRGTVIRKMADGNYLIGGDAASNDFDVSGNHGAADVWLFKITDQGNLLWQKSYGNPNSQYVVSLNATTDNKYIVGISQFYEGYPGTSVYPVYSLNAESRLKIDARGNVLWEAYNQFAVANPGVTEFVTGIVELPNRSLYQVGGRFNASIQFRPSWNFKKLNAADGNSTVSAIKTPEMNGPLVNELVGPEAVQVLTDGSVLTCAPLVDGTVLSRVNTNDNNFLYLANYGGTRLNGIIPLADGSYIAAGIKSAYSNASNDVQDFWIIKLTELNAIKGKAFTDYNGNNVKDANEPWFTRGMVESWKNGSVVSSWLDNTGGFINLVDSGTYTTTLKLNGKPYYATTPASKQSTFAALSGKDSFPLAVMPLPNKNDLELVLTSLDFARPGFDAKYHIDYVNTGTTTTANTLVKLVKPSTTTFLSATPAPSSVVADTIIWNVGTLAPQDRGGIDLKLNINPPPAVNNGDYLTIAAAINPVAGDETPVDNVDTLRMLVQGSYDPNDKRESHSGALYVAQYQAGQSLTYTVRFQNTGTDTAFNVIIMDTLSDRLDISTLEIIGGSHAYTFSLKDNKYGTFTFNNILLADSNINEPASHGYITYRIKPKAGLQVGDKIYNSASIYFDFNLPVVTNNQETVITADPVPVPPQPIITGLQPSYCGTAGLQKIKILNLPAASSGITVNAKLDGNALTIAADSTVSFTVSTLAAGNHALLFTYSNVSGTPTTTASFAITAAAVPDVNGMASVSVVTNLTVPVTITATNFAGGGKNPLYTFAWNNSFTNIIQAEGSSSTVTIQPASFVLGDNKVYVKMKTSESCYSAQTNIDSVTVRRDMSTGITDVDFPGQVITVYPNPVTAPVTISGLSSSKTYSLTITNLQGQVIYRQHAGNQTAVTLHAFKAQAGVYWLTIFDEKRNRSLGSVKLIK